MRPRSPPAKELLDRGFGKSAQALTGENGEGPIKLEVSWLSGPLG